MRRIVATLLAASALFAPRSPAATEEEPLRPRLVAQVGHAAGVVAAACSQDGRYVLTAGGKTAILWDAASRRELRTFVADAGVVTSVAFASGVGRILTCETGKVRLWDGETGRELGRYPLGADRAPRALACTADGLFFATAGPGRVAELRATATGRLVQRFEGHDRAVRAVALSPDGSQLLTGGADDTARLWDARTGNEVRRFEGHGRLVSSVSFAPDEEHVLTGSWDGTVRLWGRRTGVEVARISEPGMLVSAAAFAPDGRHVATASLGGTATLWDIAERRRVQTFPGHRSGIHALCFMTDGRELLTCSEDRTALLFDVRTGKAIGGFAGAVELVIASAFAQDGRHLVTSGHDGRARVWDLQRGEPIRSLVGHRGPVYAVCFSPDSARVLTAGRDATARLWDAGSGREVARLEGHTGAIYSACYSPDGCVVLTGSGDGTARLWDVETGQEIRRLEGHEMLVGPARFAPDGRHVVTGSLDGTARLWDVESGRELRRLAEQGPGYVSAVAFAPDGRVLSAGGDRVVRIWNAESGEEVLGLVGHTGAVTSACFSADGRRVLTTSVDRTARLWDVATGRETLRLAGHSAGVSSASFSPDGRWVLTSGGATARLWDAATGVELCRLLVHELGDWIAAAPDGRFDTNAIDEIRGLHWIMPDEPQMPLPAEVFVRDRYEPRLVPRLLAGAAFAPLRSLEELNRVPPAVRITEVRQSTEREDVATVKVEVEDRRRTYGGREHHSGACDVRLLRDGRLVRYIEGSVALDPASGRAEVVFADVTLPRDSLVGFEAYAFNVDGVKSTTSRAWLRREGWFQPLPATAYVVAVGVDHFRDPRWNLRFAAADAEAIAEGVAERLQRSGLFARVVPVRLTAPQAGEDRARFEDLETVLRLLAGKEASAERRARIPHLDAIAAARPQDLVILSISTHGYTDAEGQFYLLPSDASMGSGDGTWGEKHLSAEQLSLWLRDVDAGDMVLIVDACHAAAGVEAAGFKPGPMGARGLGQVAYDKRMQVLAASQAADVALESASVRHGLLTYALVVEGLDEGRADFEPRDGAISLAEWLRYGERRVPTLAEDVRDGRITAADDRGPLRENRRRRPVAQQPRLFDFAQRRAPILLPP